MNITLVFLMQLLIPVATAVLVSRYMGPVLRTLLEDLCGTHDRAEFWVRICTVMLMAIPPLFVLMTSSPQAECTSDAFDCGILATRHAFIYTLLGVLFGVGAVAAVMRGYVPKPTRDAVAAREPEVADPMPEPVAAQ